MYSRQAKVKTPHYFIIKELQRDVRYTIGPLTGLYVYWICRKMYSFIDNMYCLSEKGILYILLSTSSYNYKKLLIYLLPSEKKIKICTQCPFRTDNEITYDIYNKIIIKNKLAVYLKIFSL